MFDNAGKMVTLKFPSALGTKQEPWKKLFHIIPEGERQVGVSWMGWGDRTNVGPRGRKRSKDERKYKRNENDQQSCKKKSFSK